MGRRRALSVCHPFAEQIILGTKRIEYRSRSTKIRGRVYVYASKTPRLHEDWKGSGMKHGDLPTGVLIGTVEIVGCTRGEAEYEWHLANPLRLARPKKPRSHPQPAWFYPFS
jgi:hypothetical protein